jgi:hypothetical protein
VELGDNHALGSHFETMKTRILTLFQARDKTQNPLLDSFPLNMCLKNQQPRPL